MKLIYCIHSLYNPGGMERVLLGKVAWFREHTDWDVQVVTTNQSGRPTFFPLPEGVKHTDLDINYEAGAESRALRKIVRYIYKRRLHRKRLTAYLNAEKADIVISLFPSESSFIPRIHDGSRKVLEFHMNRYFRTQYGRSGIVGFIDRLRERSDLSLVKRFDSFVVLTEEDRGYWGALPNIEVIPNAAMFKDIRHTAEDSHRVIAVGRLDHQKGFDRLLQAWRLVCSQPDLKDWKLDIYGQGEWHDSLQKVIDSEGMAASAFLRGTTSDVASEFASSSFLVMSSRYEGLPMVLIEAMSCGLPAVSFACKCGPRDIINDGVNGLLVPEGDVEGLAKAMMALMRDDSMRSRMSLEAVKVRSRYDEDSVMSRWVSLFNYLSADA